MKYKGGKNRSGKEISEVLKQFDCSDYIEPFCGSLGVAIHMVDDYNCYVSDLCEDLVLLWQGVKDNTFTLPDNVSKETYLKYKDDKPSAMRGFIGFGCSYNGVWFSGYTVIKKRDYIQEAIRGIKKKEKYIKKIKGIKCCSYDDWKVKGCLIYCDPPYKNTSGYSAAGDSFDSKKFWDTVRKWSEDNIVVVSEYTAPDDFECIWSKQRKESIARTKNKWVVEKLFILKTCYGNLKKT
jgi:DNA adenine methylase